MNPSLTNVRNVADQTRCSESRKITHNAVLKPLGFMNGQAPMFSIRDHVALVEVVGHNLAMIEKGKTEREQVSRSSINPSQQHSLVANIPKAHLEQFTDSLGN